MQLNFLMLNAAAASLSASQCMHAARDKTAAVTMEERTDKRCWKTAEEHENTSSPRKHAKVEQSRQNARQRLAAPCLLPSSHRNKKKNL